MSSKNKEVFVSKYREILDIRPTCREYTPNKEEPNLCDGFLCLSCSPVIAIVWSFCCVGVSYNKIYKKCNNLCVTTEILETNGQTDTTDTTSTDVEPRKEPPKEIKKNPSLK